MTRIAKSQSVIRVELLRVKDKGFLELENPELLRR